MLEPTYNVGSKGRGFIPCVNRTTSCETGSSARRGRYTCAIVEKRALTGAHIVDPEAQTHAATLLVERGRIVGELEPEEAPGSDWRQVDLTGRLIAPGFVDLHFHGELFIAPPEEFAESMSRAAQRMIPSGTTAFLATTLAWSDETLGARVSALAEAVSEHGADGARCLGLHLEGPWISDAAPGAMSVECIRPFSPNRDADVLDRAGDLLRMVTLAPENEGAGALLEELARRGAVASLGHSRATRGVIHEAVGRGIAHVTHLFNAMGPVHHREPGVAGTVLARDDLTCDLICDGFHVHPDMVRVATRALRERLVLITDRLDMARSASEPTEGSEPLRLADGTIAGSQLSLDVAARNACSFAGIDLHEAVSACTARPAKVIGVENECGTLRPGARADLAILDPQGRVVETWVGGSRAWPV